MNDASVASHTSSEGNSFEQKRSADASFFGMASLSSLGVAENFSWLILILQLVMLTKEASILPMPVCRCCMLDCTATR